eukprot:scaffold1863_cov85-Cylindrotheca_fusiformis.AAC.7
MSKEKLVSRDMCIEAQACAQHVPDMCTALALSSSAIHMQSGLSLGKLKDTNSNTMKFQTTLLSVFLSFMAAATLADAQQCAFTYACDPDGRGHDVTSSIEDESGEEYGESEYGNGGTSEDEYGNGVTSSVDANTGFFVCRNSTQSMCIESSEVLSTDTCGCCNGKCPEMVTVLKSALESSAMDSFSSVAVVSLLSFSTAMRPRRRLHILFFGKNSNTMKLQTTVLSIFLSFMAAATLVDAQCATTFACDPDGRGHDVTSSIEDESGEEYGEGYGGSEYGDAGTSEEEYGNGYTSSVDANTGFFVCRNSTQSMCIDSSEFVSETDICGCCSNPCPEMVTVLKSALGSSAMDSFGGVAVVSLLSLSTAMILGL